MTPCIDDVKAPRHDDAAARRADRAMRAHTVAKARQLFLDDGYAVTTVAAVAAAAGVSQRTLYLAFGGKAGLVRAIRRPACPATAKSRRPSDPMSCPREHAAARAHPRHWATLSTEVAPQVAPIVLLVRVAAGHRPGNVDTVERNQR